MDVTLDVIIDSYVAIDVVQDTAIELTVVTGVSGANGAGVVAGGTTGQILRKKTGTNFDTEWADPTAAAGVSSVNTKTGIVTLNQDEVPDGTTNKQYSSTEKTKLAGVATGATANDTDANLKARANHTGAQAISTVTGLQSAIDAKAPLASPAFTGTPTGITKSHVGLGSVDNTADSAKPVSTAQQAALDLKANLASPAFTGTPTGITKSHVGLGNVDNTADTAKPVSTAQQTALDARMVWADGTTSTNARPSTSSKVIWVGGTVQPVNMTTGDIWIKA